MATYYVDATDGDDANHGECPYQPWRTVGRVNASSLVPGSRVLFKRGEAWDEGLLVSWDGVTFSAYGDGPEPVIDGGAAPAIHDTYGHDHVTVARLDLRSVANYVIELDDWQGTHGGSNYWLIDNCMIKGPVSVFGGHHLRFTNNTVDGSSHPANGNGIRDSSGAGALQMSHDNRYEGNTIHSFGVRGLWWQGKCYRNVALDNTIYDIGTGTGHGMGIDADGYDRVQWEHTIGGNTIYNCSERGIELENTFAATVQDNIVYDCGNAGDGSTSQIHVIAYSTGESGGGYGAADCRGLDSEIRIVQNLLHDGGDRGMLITDTASVILHHNTIAGHRLHGVALNSAEYCTGSEMRNNILSKNGTAGAEPEIQIPTIALFGEDDHNLIDPTTWCYALSGAPWTAYTVAQYNATTGKAGNTIQDDPRFVDSDIDNYHLQASSPAIDAGAELGLTTDLDGVTRDTSPDIGVYEYVG